MANPDKSVHTVFNSQGAEALSRVDEAWLKRGAALSNDPQSYVVPMGKVVGTQGKTNIKIVVTRVGGNQVTTAYPVP